jgi:hypothetical protein
MRATRIEDRLTPLAPDDAIEGMRGAILKLKGREGTPEQNAVLISQSALETGHWKSIHCFNVGNAKAGPTYEGFYCQFRCNEIINGKTEWFDPPHPQTNFRAFFTAADGFADHIKLLATVSRYSTAWLCAERGEAEAYSRACHAAGYYTANVESYTRGVVQLFAKYLPMVREHFAAFPTLRIPGLPVAMPEDPPPLAPPSVFPNADANLANERAANLLAARTLESLDLGGASDVLDPNAETDPDDEITVPDGKGNS